MIVILVVGVVVDSLFFGTPSVDPPPVRPHRRSHDEISDAA